MVMNQYIDAGRFSMASFEKKSLMCMCFFHLTYKVMYPKSNSKYTRVFPVKPGLLL